MASNILIVDDYIINRIILKEIIEETGYTVFEASNGKEALDMLHDTKIDLVLMDIEMPVMNGFEATKEIKSSKNQVIKKTKVIGITAHDVNNNNLEISDFSVFDGFISKPFTLDYVLECVKKNLE
jgi:CheY-like chemotaxis protein